jgi:hypothetical protein
MLGYMTLLDSSFKRHSAAFLGIKLSHQICICVKKAVYLTPIKSFLVINQGKVNSVPSNTESVFASEKLNMNFTLTILANQEDFIVLT